MGYFEGTSDPGSEDPGTGGGDPGPGDPGAGDPSGADPGGGGEGTPFGPESGGFGPDTGGFGPDTGGFGPDTGGFGPDTGGFGPDTGGFGPDLTQSSDSSAVGGGGPGPDTGGPAAGGAGGSGAGGAAAGGGADATSGAESAGGGADTGALPDTSGEVGTLQRQYDEFGRAVDVTTGPTTRGLDATTTTSGLGGVQQMMQGGGTAPALASAAGGGGAFIGAPASTADILNVSQGDILAQQGQDPFSVGQSGNVPPTAGASSGSMLTPENQDIARTEAEIENTDQFATPTEAEQSLSSPINMGINDQIGNLQPGGGVYAPPGLDPLGHEDPTFRFGTSPMDISTSTGTIPPTAGASAGSMLDPANAPLAAASEAQAAADPLAGTQFAELGQSDVPLDQSQLAANATWFNTKGGTTTLTNPQGQTQNWTDPTTSGYPASGMDPNVPGIATPGQAGLGKFFQFTDPSGMNVTVPKTDISPKGDYDLNAALANELNLNPQQGTYNISTPRQLSDADVATLRDVPLPTARPPGLGDGTTPGLEQQSSASSDSLAPIGDQSTTPLDSLLSDVPLPTPRPTIGGDPFSPQNTAYVNPPANYMSGPALPASQAQTTNIGNLSFQTGPQSAPALSQFVQDLVNAGAPITSVGGYNVRNIAGTDTLSQHAYGNAIDINQTSRDLTSDAFQDWAQDNQDVLNAAMAKNNIVSGGQWTGRPGPDFGHYEWGGPTADSAAQANVNLQNAIDANTAAAGAGAFASYPAAAIAAAPSAPAPDASAAPGPDLNRPFFQSLPDAPSYTLPGNLQYADANKPVESASPQGLDLPAYNAPMRGASIGAPSASYAPLSAVQPGEPGFAEQFQPPASQKAAPSDEWNLEPSVLFRAPAAAPAPETAPPETSAGTEEPLPKEPTPAPAVLAPPDQPAAPSTPEAPTTPESPAPRVPGGAGGSAGPAVPAGLAGAAGDITGLASRGQFEGGPSRGTPGGGGLPPAPQVVNAMLSNAAPAVQQAAASLSPQQQIAVSQFVFQQINQFRQLLLSQDGTADPSSPVWQQQILPQIRQNTQQYVLQLTGSANPLAVQRALAAA